MTLILSHHAIELLLWGWVIAAISFAGVWYLSYRANNYGFLDVAWSYGVAVLAPFYAYFGPGDHSRKWVITLIGVTWSLRLGTYILFRVLAHHPKEDPRYETLRKAWPGPFRFFLFFQLQAFIVVIFSLPFLLAAFNANPNRSPIEVIGLAIALIALVGETLADWQMQSFKRSPMNIGKICQEGLWRYSRHPNYFFEFLIWCGFFCFSLSTAWGLITVLCPALILWFLIKVTGIPLTEQHALATKGAAYREYQKTTSAFIPWFRKPYPWRDYYDSH